ncbi:hypothetical protein H311_03059, partial [Anncaliia algerae PRA109]
MSKIEDKFKENKNILIGKTYCPFCTRAKRILEKKNIDYLYLDGSDKENFELVSEVTQEYKQTTFPLIF